MLEVAGGIMPDRYKKRTVSAIRHFPKGCGRYASMPVDVEENLSPGGLSKDPVEVRESLVPDTLSNATRETDSVQTPKQEAMGLTGHPQHRETRNGGEQEVLYPSKKATEISESRGNEPPGSSMAKNHVDAVESSASEQVNDVNGVNPLGRLEVLSSYSPNFSVSTEPGGIDDGVSRLYGPSKRRKGLVNRSFPVGCGRNAPLMAREECVKKSAAVDVKSSMNEDSTRLQSFPLAKADEHNAVNTVEEKGRGHETDEERDGSGHGFELVEVVEDTGRISKVHEDQLDLDALENIETVSPLMTIQRPHMMLEDKTASAARMKGGSRIRKRKHVTEKSPLPGKKNAKKRVRPAKKRLSSLGSPHPKPRNRSSEQEIKNTPHLGEEDDDPALSMFPATEGLSVNVLPFGPSCSLNSTRHDEVPARTRVRKTLRLYQAICRKLLQNEESTLKKHGQKVRIDIAAANILKAKNQLVNNDGPIVGSVPGVEVGDQFHCRAELRLVGLHRSYQGGIDYTRVNKVLTALSIVASVGGADEMDSSDFLIYSGSGGRPAEGDKPAEDQKLERGNMALKNCIESKTPVRVVRRSKELGHDYLDEIPKQLSTLTYDGLYLVEDYWVEKGPQGFSMFKFRLRRIPGQPEISVMGVRSKGLVTRGLCNEDISGGKEKIPIAVVNTIDDDVPLPFNYITKMIYPSWYKPTVPEGCDCTARCTDSDMCSCATKNGGEIPFNFNGAIVQAKPLVYECGPSCKCPPSCHNRASQQGIKFPLEVFKTRSMGWGVRSLVSIPSGSFICEYMGELIQDFEAEQRSNDEYLFDIGHSSDDSGSSNLALESQAVENGRFTIDAVHYGNVGRFINHCCSPNLYAQNVIYDHDDKRMPHILLFAAENIPPLQELTYHYNYTIGQVHDSDGNVKVKDCHCGADVCSGRLY